MTDFIKKWIEKEIQCFEIRIKNIIDKEIKRFRTNMMYRTNFVIMNSKLIPNFKIDFLKLKYSWFRLSKAIEIKIKYKEVYI